MLVAIAGVFVSTITPTRVDAADKPNIVFILTDDQRWDALGCMGHPILKTPHVDRLAEEGAVFTNTFVTTSICAISRASFITGQYERRHKIDNFRTPLTDEQFAKTFPARLRKAGYRTGMVGKWGLGGQLPVDEFDYFTGYKGQGRYFEPGEKGSGAHLTDKLTDQCLEFLDDCAPDQPFLLQFYTKAPHCQDGDPWPFQPAPRYNDLFADVTVPLPKTATEQHFRALPEFLQTSEARKRWHIRFADDELYQKSVKDYLRLIVGIDDAVGRLVAKLKDKNLADNTVIIFTSDNGFYLGEHGLAGKWFMHEESIRVPLVIYDPRAASSLRGKRYDELVLNIDIAPTIFELAGLPIPDDVQGRSLLPLFRGERPAWRQDFLYEHRFGHGTIAQTEGVRDSRWKYVRYISVDPIYEELFDLAADPHEQRNLADDPGFKDQLARMRSRLEELIQQAE